MYFFADYVTERVWSFRYDGTTPFNGNNYTGWRNWTNIINTNIGNIDNIASFGEDLEGNLYLVDLGGEIFRITDANLSVAVDVTGLNTVRGFISGGTVSNLNESDDLYLSFIPGFTLNAQEPPVWLQFSGTATTSNPGTMSFAIEAKANTPGLTQKLYMFNYVTNEFLLLDEQNASFNVDAVFTVDAPGNAADFVDGANNNQISSWATWKANGFTILYPWTISIDQAGWSLVE